MREPLVERVALFIREFAAPIGVCLLMTGIGLVIAAFVVNEWRLLGAAAIFIAATYAL